MTVKNQSNGVVFRRKVALGACMVGRSPINALRLYETAVSRYHGVFLVQWGHLQYVDLCSTNGTKIDGARVEPDAPVLVRANSLIEIEPFELTAKVRLATDDDESEDVTEVPMPIDRADHSATHPPGTPALPFEMWGAILPPRRAEEVMGLLAELVFRFPARGATGNRDLSGGDDVLTAEILAYLTNPNAPSRMQELRAYLTAVFQRAEVVRSLDKLS